MTTATEKEFVRKFPLLKVNHLFNTVTLADELFLNKAGRSKKPFVETKGATKTNCL